MLEKYTHLSTLISMVDSKTSIHIWKNGDELFFKGKVYQLYDCEWVNDYFVNYLRFDYLFGISVGITKERV